MPADHSSVPPQSGSINLRYPRPARLRNNVKRIATTFEGKKSFEISAKQSDISQTDANTILQKFKEIGIWGMAYWSWSFLPEKTPNFNLVKFVYDKTTGEGKMKITKYFGIMENAYQEVFGQASHDIITGTKK